MFMIKISVLAREIPWGGGPVLPQLLHRPAGVQCVQEERDMAESYCLYDDASNIMINTNPNNDNDKNNNNNNIDTNGSDNNNDITIDDDNNSNNAPK